MQFETSENLPRYFKTIQKAKPLGREEEAELAAKIKSGDQLAARKLVYHNLKIVVTIANRHIGQGVPIDDLIQEGNIGLYEAALRFDPSEGARFITYAQLWIRKRINEAVVAHGRIVRLPHNQEYDIYKAKQKGEETISRFNVELDAEIDSESGTTFGDMLLNCQPEVEHQFEVDAQRSRIARAMGQLNPRERAIVAAYFGLDQEYAMPTDVIAERFEITNVRVCQIVKNSIQKIKCLV